MNVRKLLTDAQNYALDPNTPVSAALRQLLVLGTAPDLWEIREWARRELNGYRGTAAAEYPDHRVFKAYIVGTLIDGRNLFRNVRLTIVLPEESDSTLRDGVAAALEYIYFNQGVDELEDEYRQARERGELHAPVDEIYLPILRSGQILGTCIEAYRPILASEYARVLGKIRNALVEFANASLAALPLESMGPESERSTTAATTTILQSFHGCQIGAMSASVTQATNSTVPMSGGNTTNEGVVGVQNNHVDTLALKAVTDELRVLGGAVAALSVGTTDSLTSILAAIREFEANAKEQDQKTYQKVDELVEMLDPIWEKFMGASFKTWGQRMMEQGGGKMMGATPGLVKMIGGGTL